MSESETKAAVSASVENDSKAKEGGNEDFDGSLVEEGELDYDEEEEGEVTEGVKQKKKAGTSSDQVVDDNKGEEGEIESDNEAKESKSDLEEGELDDEDDLEEGELKDGNEEKPKLPKQERSYRQGMRQRRMVDIRPGRFRGMPPPEFGPPFSVMGHPMLPPRPPPIGMPSGPPLNWPDGPSSRGHMFGSSERFREQSPKKEESAWERGMKHVKEVLKAASLRKERQAQGHEGSASPHSADESRDNDVVDKRSPDRGDRRSPLWQSSDNRRGRFQRTEARSVRSRDRRRRSLSSGSRSHSRSPSPRNFYRNRRRSGSYSPRSPNHRPLDRSRQPDEWKDPWRRSPSPSSGRRPVRVVPSRRSPSPARRRRASLDKDRERERRSGGKRWRSRSRSISRSRSMSREPDVKRKRESSPRRQSRSPRRRSRSPRRRSPSPSVSRFRRDQSPRDRTRRSRSRSDPRSPSSDALQSRQRDKRSPGLDVGAKQEQEKPSSIKEKEAAGVKQERGKRSRFSSVSSKSPSSRGSSHEREAASSVKPKQTYDSVSPVLQTKIHGVSPISSPDDFGRQREMQQEEKDTSSEVPPAASQQPEHKSVKFKWIGKKRWLKAPTENVSPPTTPTPTDNQPQPIAAARELVGAPATTVSTRSPAAISNASKSSNDQEATARKQRLLDELKAVEAAIARKKAKIKPLSHSQTETTVRDR